MMLQPCFPNTINLLFITTLFFVNGLIQAQESEFKNARDITLEEALQLAIQNNRELKRANTNLAIANENVSQAKIAKAPKIGLSSYYNYVGNPKIYSGFYENGQSIDYIDHQFSGSIFTTMPLYYGGVISNQVDQQKLISEIQGLSVKMTESEIKLAVIEQFFTLEKLYRQIEVTRQNIANTSLRIKQLQSRVANGQNVKSDLLRTELQQSNFEVSVFRSKNNIELVSNYLDILTGIPTDTVLRPEATDFTVPEEDFNFQTVQEEAYQNRLEIKQSELNVKLSEEDLSISRSRYSPDISANVVFNSQYPLRWPDYINTLNSWAAGISLNWDISSIYDANHLVESNKLKIEKSTVELEATKDQINKEVKNAFVRFEESKRNIEIYKKDVELSLSNYKIVKSKYDNEFALIMDMVDAEIQLNESKISLINAGLDTIIQYFSLQYAMGKL
ncbi:MAG: TolC family protein [Flavobacterium sp.]